MVFVEIDDILPHAPFLVKAIFRKFFNTVL